MLWQDRTENDQFKVPDTVQDMSFRFQCKATSNELPVDHALILRDAIAHALPWLHDEPAAAIHRIYGAATGNGWTRPEDGEGNMMQISKRTRLSLRLPKEKLVNARLLEGTTIQLDGQEIVVGEASVKSLVATRTLFCRSLIVNDTLDEQQFTDELAATLLAMHIPITKLICGKTHQLMTNQGYAPARSVMLAELSLEDAMTLQQHGLGNHKLLGCGIFQPHKSIGAVGSSQDDV